MSHQFWEPTITVPVLMNGEHDFFFDPRSTHVQQYRYLMSPDADSVVVPDAGAAFMIERPDTARVFRAVVGAWLGRRDSESPPYRASVARLPKRGPDETQEAEPT